MKRIFQLSTTYLLVQCKCTWYGWTHRLPLKLPSNDAWCSLRTQPKIQHILVEVYARKKLSYLTKFSSHIDI